MSKTLTTKSSCSATLNSKSIKTILILALVLVAQRVHCSKLSAGDGAVGPVR